MYTQLSASVADLQTGQSEINSTVVGFDTTVMEIDGRVFKMEQNGKTVLNSFLHLELNVISFSFPSFICSNISLKHLN